MPRINPLHDAGLIVFPPSILFVGVGCPHDLTPSISLYFRDPHALRQRLEHKFSQVASSTEVAVASLNISQQAARWRGVFHPLF